MTREQDERANAGTDPVEPGAEPGEELVAADDRVIGVAFRWSLLGFAIIAVVVGIGLYLTRERETEPVVIERPPVEAPAVLQQDDPEMPSVRFEDVTLEAGIAFRHFSAAGGEKLLPETMGGGVAFFDCDGDGDQDLLFANGYPWPHDDASTAMPTMTLYRNDGRGRFEDVTEGSGLDVGFYGTGLACGDYDNDGRVDVFTAALGPNRLFRNTPDGFREVEAGVAGGPDDWSTSAGFLDYDRDGDLDLFACNYVQWSREIDHRLDFTLNGTDRAYGPPTQYEGAFCALYRNEGDGSFTDVSAPSGIQIANPATGRPMAKALAVTFADADGDGWIDVFVANDTVQNFAFRNRGDGTFEEVGSASGIAFDSMGSATGAMGMDVADYGNDGRLGLGIANFASEATSFYVQQPRDPWSFADMAGAEGIGSPSRLKLSFGLFFFDYDLDGRLDLLQANGHLEDEISAVQPSQTYRQPAQLFWNCGPDTRSCYAAVPEDAVGDLSRPIVGRGAAYADVDQDGDLDVLLTQTGDAPLLLRNEQTLGNHWVTLKLVGNGTTVPRDAIGAWVELTAGGVTQRRQVMPTRSYLSQVELPVTFGLGAADEVESLVIRWPDGTEDRVPVIPIDARTVVTQPDRDSA